MHPFGNRMLGWDEVGASWEQAAQSVLRGQVSSLDEMAVVPISEDAACTPWAPSMARRESERRR